MRRASRHALKDADAGRSEMSRPATAIVALLTLAASVGSPAAQAPPAQPPPAQAPAARAAQTIESTATAILVDVVVRDSRGRPVLDLSADDFRLEEDGVAQAIDSFTRVSRGNGIGIGVAWKSETPVTAVSPDPATPAGDPPGEESTTAIVFDHLSPETLSLAQQATLDYVPMNGEGSARVAVFATDPGIRLLQPYTSDLSKVRQAVARVSPSGTATEERQIERGDELLDRRRELREQTAAVTSNSSASGQARARNAAALGQLETELRMVQTELNMMRSFDNLDRGYRGYDTWRGLQAVVGSLAQYPGRKTLVFFSEGLPVSPVLAARLDTVIDAANRANVTAYAIDANGLRARSSLVNLRREVEGFAEERLNQLASGNDVTEQPLTMAFERVEDTLTLDSRAGLARLAGDTGGIVVEGVNDLGKAFRRIDEDARFHYLLTYSPTNTVFDGKFRRIRVRVRRSGSDVFARRGYRAVRTPGRLGLSGIESPAAKLLDRTPLPNAFPMQAGAFSFPDPVRPGLVPVVVHVATGALQFPVDQARQRYSGQADIVVRIRSGEGEDVDVLSQQYVFSGAASELEAARQGEIIFYREVDLPPGLYSVEAAVLDAAAGTGSTRLTTLNVPGPGESFQMSSLVVVSRTEKTSDAPREAAGRAPLYVGSSLIYPNLGEPVQRSAAAELPFYFTLYGDVAGVSVTAELLRQGQSLASAPVTVADTSRPRVQHVGRLPIGQLPAGTYELRITASRDARSLVRTAYFTVRE